MEAIQWKATDDNGGRKQFEATVNNCRVSRGVYNQQDGWCAGQSHIYITAPGGPSVSFIVKPESVDATTRYWSMILVAGCEYRDEQIVIETSHHRCRVCGEGFSVKPARDPSVRFDTCLLPGCDSFDHGTDAEVIVRRQVGQEFLEIRRGA